MRNQRMCKISYPNNSSDIRACPYTLCGMSGRHRGVPWAMFATLNLKACRGA